MEHIADDLGQPGRVADGPQRAFGKLHLDFQAGAFEAGPVVFDDRADDFGQIDALLAEQDLATRDARHIEQVVDQAGHMGDLAINDVASLDERR